MLQKKQADPNYDDVEERNRRTRIVADTEQVLLEVLDSNRAAFQTVLEPKLSNIASNDLMKAQVIIFLIYFIIHIKSFNYNLKLSINLDDRITKYIKSRYSCTWSRWVHCGV